MLEREEEKSRQLEITCLEDLVRPDHLLRKIKKHVDFSFIRDKVKGLYCEDNGRPAVDPVVLFKMLFIGYLFGIRSERRLVHQINDNMPYRWFLGFSLSEPIPDHSTISQNRRRRFNGTTVYQEIFDEIVRRAIQHGLVDGKVLYSDATHIKANANKRKHLLKQVPVSTKSGGRIVLRRRKRQGINRSFLDDQPAIGWFLNAQRPKHPLQQETTPPAKNAGGAMSTAWPLEPSCRGLCISAPSMTADCAFGTYDCAL